MSGFRLLDLVKFFMPILPEIELPDDNVHFDERIVFTIGAAFIFLVGQIPIYGLVSGASYKIEDPLTGLRSIFAMEKGTLLELGLLPIVTSAFLWQLGTGLKLINVNLNFRTDRELFQTGQKITSFFLSIIYGVGLIGAGYYDNVIQKYNPLGVESPPFGSYALILLQIVAWSFIVTLMVEVFDKGYAFGTGVLCFLALQVATNFVKDLVGFEKVQLLNSNKFESYGSIINLIDKFKSFPSNVFDSFNRAYLPNFTQTYVTVIVVGVFIYLQSFRIELPIRSTKVRGMNNVYPIKLLYNGALPLLFSYSIFANIKLLGFAVSKAFELPILGKWSLDLNSNNLNVISGFLFYFDFTFQSPIEVIFSPIKSLISTTLFVVSTTWFANKWSYISGSAPKDISKQFKEQGISIAGKRDVSITKDLSRVIPVAAVSGSFILAILSAVSEYLGSRGKASSCVLAISAAFGVLEELMMEYQQSGGNSQFGNVFGGMN